MPRRVVPDQLTDDVTTQRTGTEDGKDFEGDDGRIGRAPTEVGLCVFSPCWWEIGGKSLSFPYWVVGNAHISAKGPSLPFTVLPNVERYNHEPSYVK